MSSRRFTAEEVLSQLINWDSDVEEEISEMEDSSEPEDNAIDDPDCQFSHDDEDSEDESTSVPSTDENQETQQSSSTEGIWTSKDGAPAQGDVRGVHSEVQGKEVKRKEDAGAQ
ncbi:hypothetical protein SRHO_G00087620 [Serrasalmus rhombeus]